MMLRRGSVELLRDRPHEERETIAAAGAIGIAIVLFIVWGVLFLNSVREATPLQNTPTEQEVPAQTESKSQANTAVPTSSALDEVQSVLGTQ